MAVSAIVCDRDPYGFAHELRAVDDHRFQQIVIIAGQPNVFGAGCGIVYAQVQRIDIFGARKIKHALRCGYGKRRALD